LGSGGLLPADIGGRVCRFFCPSRYVARHRKLRRCVYVLNLGGTDIRPPDSFSYRSNFRFRSSFHSRSNFRSSFSFSFSFSFVLIFVFVLVLVPVLVVQQAATYSIAAVAGN